MRLLLFSVACTLECPAQKLILGEVGRRRPAAVRGGEGRAAAANVERGARTAPPGQCGNGAWRKTAAAAASASQSATSSLDRLSSRRTAATAAGRSLAAFADAAARSATSAGVPPTTAAPAGLSRAHAAATRCVHSPGVPPPTAPRAVSARVADVREAWFRSRPGCCWQAQVIWTWASDNRCCDLLVCFSGLLVFFSIEARASNGILCHQIAF